MSQPSSPANADTPEFRFGYTNWEGRNSYRHVRPISIRYGKSKWHPKVDWLMLAFDLDKNEEREFSMRDMILVEPADALPFIRAQQMTDYAAWLVEINERSGPVYFQFVHDDDWTKDHDKAAHFSRKEDAERVIEHYGWTSAKAVEHMWPSFTSPDRGQP